MLCLEKGNLSLRIVIQMEPHSEMHGDREKIAMVCCPRKKVKDSQAQDEFCHVPLQ